MIDYKQIERDKSKTKFYIYVWKRPDKPEEHSVFYVGKGCKNRYRSLTNERLENKHLKHVIEKVGWDNIQKQIIEYNLENLQAYEREKYYIKLYEEQGCILVNLTEGGDGSKGWYDTLSDEEKEFHRQYSKSFVGKKHTEETKKKMSDSAKGHQLDNESRKKLSETRKRKFASGELKAPCQKQVVCYDKKFNTYTLYESITQLKTRLNFDFYGARKNTQKNKLHLDRYFVYYYDDWKTQQTTESIVIEKYNNEEVSRVHLT